jgi:protein-disulfide isomerase
MGFRNFVIALGGLLLAACGQGARTFTPVEGDASMGPASASVVLVEYGAPTCPACLDWHKRTWKELKSAYIESGKIRFVFRPLPSHNPPVDAAIAAIARCVGAEEFMNVIDEGFARHQQIEEASMNGVVQTELVSLAAKFGMSEAQTQACIKDPANRKRIFDVQAQAEQDGVTGTPTFLVDGRIVRDPSFRGLSQAIDTALAAPVPPSGAPAQPAPTPDAASAPAPQ